MFFCIVLQYPVAGWGISAGGRLGPDDLRVLPVASRGLAVDIFEGSGKMKLIGVADLNTDVFYREIGCFQKLRRF